MAHCNALLFAKLAWVLFTGSLCVSVLGVPVTACFAEVAPVEYTVTFEGRKNHYLEIEARIPTDGDATVELMMAVWTPGSYLVREYARHVESLSVRGTDGKAVEFKKTRKNRWRVDARGYSHLMVEYRLYCREMTVRSNWVQHDYAMINGAPTFITKVGALDRPHDVRFVLPDGWKGSYTGLESSEDAKPHHYRAPDFDTLVDCPVLLGSPTVHEFEVGELPHSLVNLGEDDVWDGPRSAKDVEKIVREQFAFWGHFPYEHYVFLNMIVQTGGGLEHKNSTLMMTSRWNTGTRKNYLRWLGLVSHEFFHTWNVKRLRPIELGPFDYENEVYTRSLWFAEGLTSYYDDLLLRRAGLMTTKEYLEALSRQIERLQTTPGRLSHPLEQTSYDAWIKFYRRDENSPNTTISYYTKGAVVGFLLDARIRQVTKGERSLDDVMRLMYKRYSGATGFTSEDFRGTASEIAGVDLSDWLAIALDSTEELDYQAALDWYGLRFKDPESEEDTDEGKSEAESSAEPEAPEDPRPGWIGLKTRTSGDRLIVNQVRRETPAHDAGLQVDDEILAIDGYRVLAGQWEDRLKLYPPNRKAELLIARREKLLTVPITFLKEPENTWELEIHPEESDGQKARRKRWLKL